MIQEQITEGKNCAFQYAYTRGTIFRDTKIVHDESNLTLTQAKELFKKYQKEIMNILKNKDDYQSLEAVIWVNMPDEFSYGEHIVYVTLDFETDGKDIWETIKQYVKL
jgi:hypothetical protein